MEGRGLLGDPSSCSATPATFSTREFHGGRVWQGGTISRQIQSTAVLSAMRPIFSTSEPPPERPQHASTTRATRPRTPGLFLLPEPALPPRPHLPQAASCRYAVKPPPTRDKHALLPLRIRAVQVSDTCPRADHGPVPTDTPQQRHLLSSRCSCSQPIRRHCRTDAVLFNLCWTALGVQARPCVPP